MTPRGAEDESSALSPTRAKTRAALVDAALRLFSRKPVGETAVHEIAQEAGVSNGSFYNYFQTREDVVAAAAQTLSKHFTGEISASYAHITDPAERVAIGSRRFMERAALDPVWGAAVLGVWNGTPLMAKRVSAAMRQDLRAGKRAGRFAYRSDSAAIDLVQGAVLAGIRTILEGVPGKKHARDVCALILTGLGVPAAEAKALATKGLPPLGQGDNKK